MFTKSYQNIDQIFYKTKVNGSLILNTELKGLSNGGIGISCKRVYVMRPSVLSISQAFVTSEANIWLELFWDFKQRLHLIIFLTKKFRNGTLTVSHQISEYHVSPSSFSS